eukprot:symbB.v1.2.008522.t1/scaffold527.1/size293072/20
MTSVQTSLLLVQRTEVGNGPFAATLERGLANVPAEVYLRDALKKSEDQAAKLSAKNREVKRKLVYALLCAVHCLYLCTSSRFRLYDIMYHFSHSFSNCMD